MIPAFVPALSLAGFIARSSMTPQDVMGVESKFPGFVVRQCRGVQAQTWDQLRKRYLVDSLGQTMGPPSGAGTAPPQLTFTGVPTSGDLEIIIKVTTPGPIGVALFSWSKDAGQTQVATGVATEAGVPLPGTGLTVYFPAIVGGGAAYYSSDNVYTSGTPIREEVLLWLADVVTPRVWDRRGVNASNDDQIKEARARRDKAEAYVAQAANSRDGLWDLPLNTDTTGSNVTQGGPLGYSEQSPYTWQDRQRAAGRGEDSRHCGDFDE